MLTLWIFKKDNAKRVIGNVMFNNIVKGNLLSCQLGYRLDYEEVNRGYITEAIKRGIEIIFDGYKLRRIEANVMVSNRSSIKVLEKLCFSNKGITENYLKVNGKWEDYINMVLENEYIV